MKNAGGGTVQRPHIMRRRAFKTRVHLTFDRLILGPLYLKSTLVSNAGPGVRGNVRDGPASEARYTSGSALRSD